MNRRLLHKWILAISTMCIGTNRIVGTTFWSPTRFLLKGALDVGTDSLVVGTGKVLEIVRCCAYSACPRQQLTLRNHGRIQGPLGFSDLGYFGLKGILY